MTISAPKTGLASSPSGRWAGFRVPEVTWRLLDAAGGLVAKHRLEEASRRRGRLVCPAFGVDPVSGPSNLRECWDCGAQVAVAAGASTALVEAGELWPQCRNCWIDNGRKTLAMHPALENELMGMGRLVDGWRRLGELNAGPDDESEAL